MTTIWIIVAAVFAVVEMGTGTFYLLVLAVAAGAGAVTSYVTPDLAVQMGVAAIVAVIGYGGLQKMRGGRARLDVSANPDVNIDIGSVVHIADVGVDGDARVNFRGAEWAARVDGGAAAVPGARYKIARIDGNILVLHSVE
jgi:membrane protein implicated in regulation of membrane protease activity